MSKFEDLVVLKTNKPNSKKNINLFLEEYGYLDFITKIEENKSRNVGIYFLADDIEDEIKSFSKNIKKDKITVHFYKANEKEKHLVKSIIVMEGKIIEKEEYKEVLLFIEKENKRKEKELLIIQKKSQDIQPSNISHNKYKKEAVITFKHDERYPQKQELSTVNNNFKTKKTIKPFVKKDSKKSKKPIKPKDSIKNNKKEVVNILNEKERQRLNNKKANENNPNHPDYKGIDKKIINLKIK